MTGSAKQSIKQQARKVDCFVAFAPRNDVEPQLRDLAAHFRASFARSIPPSEDQRAQGMPGARRARSLACKIK